MRAVIQRVLSASVAVDGKVVGSVEGPGLLVLLGVTHDDGPAQVAWMARKIWDLRIMRDEQSASDLGAPVLVVSQFTLYGDARKGRRPTWAAAAPGQVSEPVYEAFCSSKTLATLPRVGEAAVVHIEMIVREDLIRLYGFATEAEKAWFQLLLTVQGVGARVALSILSTLAPRELSSAIALQDKSMIGRANGVVNIGGFTASLVAMAVIGWVLDLRQPGGMTAYDLGDFRAALATQYAFWALGIWQVLRYRRRALAHLRREHPGAIESMRAGRPFVHPGFSDSEGV